MANDVSNCIAICFSGIITGCTLAISRAIGEAAPLLVIGALAFANYVPFSMFDRFTVLPIQVLIG